MSEFLPLFFFLVHLPFGEEDEEEEEEEEEEEQQQQQQTGRFRSLAEGSGGFGKVPECSGTGPIMAF